MFDMRTSFSVHVKTCDFSVMGGRVEQGAKKCFRGRVVLDSHVVLEVRAVLALACALLRALLGAPHVPGMLSMAAASLEEGEGDARPAPRAQCEGPAPQAADSTRTRTN